MIANGINQFGMKFFKENLFVPEEIQTVPARDAIGSARSRPARPIYSSPAFPSANRVESVLRKCSAKFTYFLP